jgi:protein-S-isoprenylcysteine O-methyltransferase Ste14
MLPSWHALELKIPPVALTLMVAAAMWALSRFTPLFAFSIPLAGGAAALLAATGGAVALSGILSFRRAKTTLNPIHPGAASALVTSGIYRFTRNPMYLGLFFVLVGWAAWLQNVLAPIGAPLFILYMNRFQIIPEERALSAIFGGQFRAYATRVRRWI